MARKLRIQYKNAVYHVINRGNYRREVFASAGTAEAFVDALGEASEAYRWKVHAYVVMRNHYHLAVETPKANLVEGMHWLQSTFATRFNRLRKESGHLFQGRYQALLVQNAAAVFRVANYIHLNPVRAKVVRPGEVEQFRWSSLPRLLKAERPEWLTGEGILAQLEAADTPRSWRKYVAYLIDLANDVEEQRRQGFAGMSHGWAIGTDAWRKAVAKDHAHLALSAGIARDELKEIREASYTAVLEQVLEKLGKGAIDVRRDALGSPWKIAAAARLRKDASAPYPWIAKTLNMGSPSSVRVYLCTLNRS